MSRKSTGSIEVTKVKGLKKNDNSMFDLAETYRKRAYSPYSNFKVGAALLTNKGLFGGCNVENASFGATICAERTAILKAVSEEAKEFERIIIVTDTVTLTPPCALCLQMMAEFCKPDFVVEMRNTKGKSQLHKFKDLLTHPFGPQKF